MFAKKTYLKTACLTCNCGKKRGTSPKKTPTCLAKHKPNWGAYQGHLSGQAQMLLGLLPKKTPTCLAKHKPYWGPYPRKRQLIWLSTNATGRLPKETPTCMAKHKHYWGAYPRKLTLVWPSTNPTGALTQGNSHLFGQAQTQLGRLPKETPTCMAKHKPYWGAYPRKLPLVWPSTNPTGALTQGNSH